MPPTDVPSRGPVAFIILDDDDQAFFDSWWQGDHARTRRIPLSYNAILQAVFEEERTGSADDDEMRTMSLDTKTIYGLAHEYLARIFASHPLFPDATIAEAGFPLLYYWYCLFTAIFRLIHTLRQGIEQRPGDEVFLVKRRKTVVVGGLRIDQYAVACLLEAYGRSKGWRVRTIQHDPPGSKGTTVYYYGKKGLRTFLKRAIYFIKWKYRSRSLKEYRYILINPSHDNVIHYRSPYLRDGHGMPQVYFDDAVPFFHDLRSIIRFYLNYGCASRWKIKTDFTPVPYPITIDGFSFDLSTAFINTTRTYLSEVAARSAWVGHWWSCLPKHTPIKAIVFSLSPVFLDSYCLIDTIKKNGGKVITWQHGGFFGYADHPIYRITDYGPSDIFLTYGQGHPLTDAWRCYDGGCKRVPVGTNNLYPRNGHRSKSGSCRAAASEGVYIPSVIGTVYTQSRPDWDPVRQFSNTRRLIDLFATGDFGRIVVKGLSGHPPHRAIAAYIRKKSIANISYDEVEIGGIYEKLPRFVLFDAPSTPLLETMSRFDGPIFLLNCQPSWKIHPAALDSLKKRVFYAETVAAFTSQFKKFEASGETIGRHPADDEFLRRYAAPFCLDRYNAIISQVTRRHAHH
ncbi:MAG: hypothetical protein ABIL58_12020 [Pseudomonadota bacterium]